MRFGGVARANRRLFTLGAALGMVLVAGAADAQDEWKDDEGERPPPVDRPAKPQDATKKQDDAAAPADPSAAPSRFIADLKVGPAFILTARGITEFGLQLNVGYAIAQDVLMKGGAFYLTVSPYLVVGEDLTLVAPLGAQLELPLAMIPYEGISAYARTSVGYAYHTPRGFAIDQGYHGFAVQPALGAKVTFLERFSVGIEPIGFDIVHVIPPSDTLVPPITKSAFQLYIFGGARF